MGADVHSNSEIIENGTSDYPISVLVLHADGQKEIHDTPEQFLRRLDKETVDSIHSLGEVFAHNTRAEEMEQKLTRYEMFYSFYFNYLPIVILADKQSSTETHHGVDSSIRAKAYLDFVFTSGTPESPAEKAIKMADKYGYNSQERFNLFARAVYEREVSEQDLLDMMSAWGINGQRGIYMHNYKKYAGSYRNIMNVETNEGIEDQKTFPLFSPKSPVISSLLHEVFVAERFLVFEALLKSGSPSSVELNMPDYMGRSVLHLMTGHPWETAKPYFEFLTEYQQMIDFNMQEHRGLTPLAYAIAYGDTSSLEWIKQLLAFKARMQLNIVDNDQRTTLTLAAERFMPEAARLLYKAGVPRQTEVSATNVFIDENFRPFEFTAPLGVRFDNELIQMFDLDVERGNKKISYHAFFETLKGNKMLKELKFLKKHRFYFLFKLLSAVFEFEEEVRADFIISSLAGQKPDGENDARTEESFRLLKAVWTGDLSFLQRFFSIPENRRKYLNSTFLSYVQEVHTPNTLRVFSSLELGRYFRADIQSKKGNVVISVRNMNLLVEAVRFNQPEVVSFLLEAGASPIQETGSFGIKNAIVAGILSSLVFLPYQEQHQRHKQIMQSLLAHPDVTTEFLQGRALFGVSYADLAAIRGNLSVLKLLYDKGIKTSPALSFWNTRVSALDVAFSLNFLEIVQFILEQQLKNDPGNKGISKMLRQCRRAFN